MRPQLSASNQFCPERPFPSLHITHCLNLFLDFSLPGGFRSVLLSFPLMRVTLGILLWGILKVRQSHRIRRPLILVWIGSEIVLACNSKFEMVLGQKIRQILRKHPWWNVSILWKSVKTTCQHPNTGLRLAKAFLALLSLFLMSFCALLSLLITLPSYVKLSNYKYWISI